MGKTVAIAGTGYVGLSIAVLLAQHCKVYAVDIAPEKVEWINQKNLPFKIPIFNNTWLKKNWI